MHMDPIRVTKLKNDILTKTLFDQRWLCLRSDNTPVGTTKKPAELIPVRVYVATGPLFEIVT